MNNKTFFFGGVFSQWYPSEFTLNNIQYSTAEQYMMAGKARLFKDKSRLAQILVTSNPSEQKALGRAITPFDVDQWNAVARDVVYEGNLAKFTQNKHPKEQLLKTEGTLLVEASPTDRLWGIGLEVLDERCKDESQWRGVNWLGEVLTKVRDDLIAEELLYSLKLNGAYVQSEERIFDWSDNIHIYKEMPPV